MNASGQGHRDPLPSSSREQLTWELQGFLCKGNLWMRTPCPAGSALFEGVLLAQEVPGYGVSLDGEPRLDVVAVKSGRCQKPTSGQLSQRTGCASSVQSGSAGVRSLLV